MALAGKIWVRLSTSAPSSVCRQPSVLRSHHICFSNLDHGCIHSNETRAQYQRCGSQITDLLALKFVKLVHSPTIGEPCQWNQDRSMVWAFLGPASIHLRSSQTNWNLSSWRFLWYSATGFLKFLCQADCSLNQPGKPLHNLFASPCPKRSFGSRNLIKAVQILTITRGRRSSLAPCSFEVWWRFETTWSVS